MSRLSMRRAIMRRSATVMVSEACNNLARGEGEKTPRLSAFLDLALTDLSRRPQCRRLSRF